ncbi:hypothetical protein GCM10020221_28210 [Streptomyces thioluteus]|uniref:Tyrosine--tRNA ligase n=1 Tax=Streptomyces thioluteus TaxID=66431 RepID=A0ABN3WZ83_STRTU
MTRLGESVARASELLAQDLSTDSTVEQLLTETKARRYLDLRDLSPEEQAALIAGRAVEVLPGREKLAERIGERRAAGKGLHIKLGIDPTAADVHLGHTVPMIVLSRFQRMGHDVTLLIGDFTAKIGDPTGRTAERPPLTDADIEKNLAGYREQVRPFFDFDAVRFVQNSEWLSPYTFPELLSLLSQVPVSQLLQREDFRNRLASGSGLTMSELLYPGRPGPGLRGPGLRRGAGRRRPAAQPADGPQADGAARAAATAGRHHAAHRGHGRHRREDVQVQGQLRRPERHRRRRLRQDHVRAGPAHGAVPQGVDGVDGRGDLPRAVPDRGALTAPDGPQEGPRGRGRGRAVRRRGRDGRAGGLIAQFSKKSFTDVEALPVVEVAEHGAGAGDRCPQQVLGFQPSASAARRVAKQNGLRLVVETGSGQQAIVLAESDAIRPARGGRSGAAGQGPGSAPMRGVSTSRRGARSRRSAGCSRGFSLPPPRPFTPVPQGCAPAGPRRRAARAGTALRAVGGAPPLHPTGDPGESSALCTPARDSVPGSLKCPAG